MVETIKDALFNSGLWGKSADMIIIDDPLWDDEKGGYRDPTPEDVEITLSQFKTAFRQEKPCTGPTVAEYLEQNPELSDNYLLLRTKNEL